MEGLMASRTDGRISRLGNVSAMDGFGTTKGIYFYRGYQMRSNSRPGSVLGLTGWAFCSSQPLCVFSS